jgi:hypothetical protein
MCNDGLEFVKMVDLNQRLGAEFKSLQIPSYVTAKTATKAKATVETLDKQEQSIGKQS